MVLSNHMGGELAANYSFCTALDLHLLGDLRSPGFSLLLADFSSPIFSLKEWNLAGTINLKRFYLRRAFRIFPPLYAYLAVALMLTLLGYFPAIRSAFLVAATYTWNDHPGRQRNPATYVDSEPGGTVLPTVAGSTPAPRAQEMCPIGYWGHTALTCFKDCYVFPDAGSSRESYRNAALWSGYDYVWLPFGAPLAQPVVQQG